MTILCALLAASFALIDDAVISYFYYIRPESPHYAAIQSRPDIAKLGALRAYAFRSIGEINRLTASFNINVSTFSNSQIHGMK